MSDELPLKNDPLVALARELAAVTPSPEFAHKVRATLADEFEPLRTELSELTVSPEFAVRVRQGVEQADARRPWWFSWGWRVVAPAAALVIAVVAGFMMLKPVPKQAPVTVAKVDPPVAAEATRATPILPRSAPRVNQIARAESPRVTTAAHPVRPRDPMLTVVTDQPALLRNLTIRVAPGVSVDSTEPAGTYQAPTLEVAPIEVGTIPAYVVPDTTKAPGMLPFILRQAAGKAERSSR